MAECMKKYMSRLFSPEYSTGAISTTVSKEEDIANGFRNLGYQVEIVRMEDEEEDDDDDEEDEDDEMADD
jgi:hypothetical protein